MYNTLGNRTETSSTINRIRETALKDTALSLGAQAGLAARAKVIDDALNKNARTFDTIFNFNALTLAHNILPPVLVTGENIFNLADNQTIRISDRTYKIAKQAHFITTVPNWRQYLWMDYKKPAYPNLTLLPKNKEERQIWSRYVNKGWKQGHEQADIIFAENIARIKEDFSGMILYRKLLAMNMVSAPYVSHTDFGVTGDHDEIHIDDRVLRITELPALNMNSRQWKAAVSKHEDKLTKFRQMEQMVQNAQLSISNQSWQPVISPTS